MLANGKGNYKHFGLQTIYIKDLMIVLHPSYNMLNFIKIHDKVRFIKDRTGIYIAEVFTGS